ncbi:MAG: hypothetical protein KGR48_09910 [Alphaproteobacteria bacterium]|nr:hypothetical protein [Alphaproteobacteria bacterium]MDE2013474.1 hypothetical protein [Alphaproteobacteria bacterium]MDE2073494.1 hypothetical protein [Alphaproteobacteria bacterium]MDE2350851.1 hypothetical protein [Alphaproteobacteria bacterium]
MEPDRITLDAFVDGELPPAEMERIALLLETHPDLNRYVQEQEHLRAALRAAFDETLAAPMPEKLSRAVRSAPVSWRWRLRALVSRGFSIRVLGPIGAALAMGVVLGIAIRPSAEFGADAAGRLIAQGDLGRALNTRLAAVRYNGAGPQIGLSFRNKAGRDCRTFSADGSAGLACRQDGAWVVAILVKQAPENPGAAYRMAGSAMPEVVRRAVADSIAGAPFDAAAEKAARERGWSGG